MSKSKGRWVNLHGMGFLPLLGFATMRSLPEKSEGKAFSFTSMEWRMLLIGVLFLADMAAQTCWTVHMRTDSIDAWWAGLLGWSSYDFNAGGIIAGVFGALSAAPGLLLFFMGLIFKRVFLPGMVLLLNGLAVLSGVGLGDAILYVQVRNGAIPADSADAWANPYSRAAAIADGWPVVVAAVVFAAAALAFALLSRRGSDVTDTIQIGGGVSSFIGLMGITLVECGLIPTTPVLVAIAVFVAFRWLPGEVRASRECEARRVGAVWEWHAASLIWLETLFALSCVIASALDI